MKRIQNFLRRWMMGRNGFDALNRVIFGLYLVAWIVDLVVNSWITSTLSLLVVVLFFFRFFSRNLYQRNKENQVLLRVLRPLRSLLQLQQRKFKERKTHRFRRCKQCRTILRVKRVRGRHTVVCPRCRHENKVRIWW